MSVLFHNLRTKCLTFLLNTKVYQLSHKNYSTVIMELKENEAIIRYDKGDTHFNMSFRYINPETNLDRIFNFCRQVDEPISKFLEKIENNISIHRKKKYMRKEKKKYKHMQEVLNKVKEIMDNENYNSNFIRNESIIDKTLTCKSILDNMSNIKLVISDKEYIIKGNSPHIKKIELPSIILANFLIYPSKFEARNIDKTTSIFKWYRKENNNWILVGKEYFYTPTISDVGCYLKLSCEPRNKTESGPTVQIVSDNFVQLPPREFPFEKRHAFTKNKLSGKNFRVTSYNILANTYSLTSLSKETLYPYCPVYALSIDYRKLLILKELIGYNSDIICLQEVDKSVYELDLAPILSNLNYGSTFNVKNDLCEGLAMFYDQNRFDLLTSDFSVISQSVNLKNFNSVWSLITNYNLKKSFLSRNTIIQVGVLKSKENSEILIVGNTHLYFRPQANSTRLLQAYCSLMYLNTFADRMKAEYPKCNVSILYCGDFNSTPENAVYQLMTESYVPADHSDWETDCEESVKNICIRHDLRLSSACGTPEYTNCTATFSGCLDYIFYETDNLKVEQVIPMPSKKQLFENVGLPSVVFPSDHISLCADLTWSK